MITPASISSRLAALPRWVLPAVAAVLAALVTLGIASAYYSGVVSQWEQHAAAVEGERDAALAEVEDVSAELEIVSGDRDAYRDSVTASEDRAVAAEGRIAEVEEREAAVATAEAAVAAREAAVTGAEQRIAETTIREGTWVVGRDVEPGTYATAGEVRSGCYWSIYVSGTNQDDIVQNDIVTGGRPTVTIAEGQDFTTRGCGSWLKQ
ncbi:hypothetical protein [Miniimonas sp. S16]|uniref:hypothetical protein n=1 Tax=Miniimonas sp. S16 TaxID=2171623 RepID=UPI000D529AE5|nr:hypothetical protein [Miniimonas sp. S16]